MQSAPFGEAHTKVRFSVTSPAQNAPFGHVATASPAQSAVFRETAIASKIVVYGRREKKTIAYPRMSVRPRND